ncbi:pyridoxal-phosphate dependent enzyme [soil metagenome]
MFFNTGTAPIQEIRDPLFLEKKVQLFVKREDLLHPHVSGNKWRKLKYNLIEARKRGHHTLLTFGGAYSNHIHAVAAAGKELGFKTIGISRGENKLPHNPTLAFAAEQDMLLHFISREEYSLRKTHQLRKDMVRLFGDFYLIPEGGANLLGVKGCVEIVKEIEIDYDYICTSCGTGATLAGLVVGLQGEKEILGFSVLKGGRFLQEEVQKLVKECKEEEFNNWKIIEDYHFGGYGKHNSNLIDFINFFKKNNELALDPIYTGKMMYGILDMVRNGYFRENSVIVALHTGGLQGIEGFNQRFGKLIH